MAQYGWGRYRASASEGSRSDPGPLTGVETPIGARPLLIPRMLIVCVGARDASRPPQRIVPRDVRRAAGKSLAPRYREWVGWGEAEGCGP